MTFIDKASPPVRLSIADIRLRQMIALIGDVFQFNTLLYVGARTNRFMFGTDFAEHHYHITIVEIFKENVDYLQTLDFIQNVHHMDIRNIEKSELAEKTFDIVMWYHGPEHVKPNEFLDVLPTLEKITRHHLIIACPWGEYQQDAIYGNPFEVHQHAYYPQFFSKLNFQVNTLGDKDVPGSNILAWKSRWIDDWFSPPSSPSTTELRVQDQDNPYFYYYNINAFAEQADFVKLEKWLKRYSLQFSHPLSHIVDAICSFYANQEQPIDKILKWYQYFFHRDMLGAEGLFRLAVTYRIAGKYSAASTLFNRMKEHSGSHSLKHSIHYESGIVYLFNDQYLEAVDEFHHALTVDSQHPIAVHRILFRIGQAYYALGHYADAREHLENCLEHCPNHGDAQTLLQSLPHP